MPFKKNNITIFSHLLIWLVLFSIPYMLSYGQSQEINRILIHFWIPLGFYAIIFYVNYFILIDNYMFSKKTILFIGLNLFLIALFIFLKEYIETNFFQEISRNSPNEINKVGPPIKMVIYLQILSYMAPILFSIALKTTQRLRKIEVERKEADNFKLESEIQHLRYQLQPHFFFNSLNNIYSLIDISPEQAKSSVHSLSKLMRYMLYETNVEQIFLSKEIDFMKKYIDLMKLRLTENTKINYSFPDRETGIKIAPLLFISLIENAFKHGVSANNNSTINILMTVTEKKLFFKIENNNFPKQTDDKSGSGIGLQNLEKRLLLLYPNKHVIKTELKDGKYSTRLQIEF